MSFPLLSLFFIDIILYNTHLIYKLVLPVRLIRVFIIIKMETLHPSITLAVKTEQRANRKVEKARRKLALLLALLLLPTLACGGLIQAEAAKNSAEATINSFFPPVAPTTTVTPDPDGCSAAALGINPEETMSLPRKQLEAIHLQTKPGDPPITDFGTYPLGFPPEADCILGPIIVDEEGKRTVPTWTQGIDLDHPSGKPQIIWEATDTQ